MTDACLPSSPRFTVPCIDLDAAMAFYTDELGFRLDMIMPADAPRFAELSGHGIQVRLEREGDAAPRAPDVQQDAMDALPIFCAAGADGWSIGRAGMHYRDLVPGRMGGFVIASHIRIPEGGPVPDYVHYHRVGFQMIFCRRGWVRVVYEDQGPPFVMQAGDCVLQPPTIRHRVLEASPGLEVVEIGCPAEHETRRDHALTLPTSEVRPQRVFGGQRFVRDMTAEAVWTVPETSGCTVRDTSILEATNGLAGVRILRMVQGTACVVTEIAQGVPEQGVRFLFVLEGRMDVRGAGKAFDLEADAACLVPASMDFGLHARTDAVLLEVGLSTDCS